MFSFKKLFSGIMSAAVSLTTVASVNAGAVYVSAPAAVTAVTGAASPEIPTPNVEIPYSESVNSVGTDNDGLSLRRNIYNVWGNNTKDIDPNTEVKDFIAVNFTVSGIGDDEYNVKTDGTSEHLCAYILGSVGANSVWEPENTTEINGDGTYNAILYLDEPSDSIVCLILQTNIDIYNYGYTGEGTEPTAWLTVNHIYTGTDSSYMLGDVNGDGLVDVSDASMILNAYANLAANLGSGLTAEQEKAADVNGDGLIDSSDSSMIKSYYAYVSAGGTATFTEYLTGTAEATTTTTTTTTTTKKNTTTTTTTKKTTTATTTTTSSVSTTTTLRTIDSGDIKVYIGETVIVPGIYAKSTENFTVDGEKVTGLKVYEQIVKVGSEYRTLSIVPPEVSVLVNGSKISPGSKVVYEEGLTIRFVVSNYFGGDLIENSPTWKIYEEKTNPNTGEPAYISSNWAKLTSDKPDSLYTVPGNILVADYILTSAPTDDITGYLGWHLKNGHNIYFDDFPFTLTLTAPEIVYGDATCDGDIRLNDAVLIMQALSNPNKFGITGTDELHITSDGWNNADCNAPGDGVSGKDALAIQKYALRLIDSLPEE